MRSAGDLPVRPRDPSSVEGTARSIVSQAQFRPPGRTVPERVWHWITTEISRLLASLGVGNLHIPPVAIVVVLGAMAVVAGVAIVRSGSWRGLGRRPKGSPAMTVSADDLGVAAEVWLRRAEAAEAGGDWKEGMRCRHRALVALLAASRAVTEEVGHTAGDYRRAVDQSVPDAASAFAAATDAFEQTWYGFVDAGPSQRDVVAAAVGPVTDAGRRYRQTTSSARSGESGGSDDGVGSTVGAEVTGDIDAGAGVSSGAGPAGWERPW